METTVVEGLGLRPGLGLRVWGLRFRVLGLRFWA